jgi:manganese transport protein
MKSHSDSSLSEVHASVDTTRPNQRGWRRLFSFLGPAYLISVGYMDPGNWATDLQGGAQFGYSLLWVLLMSNLMALLLQGFSARLGIVRGRDLAQANRETYPRGVNYVLYGLAEIAIAATDLAEVLGMAIGIHLLTGLPLVWGVGITVFDTLLLLYLQRLGIRKMEAFIIGLVAVVAGSFLLEIILAKPDPIEVAAGLIPSFANEQALYIAIGIIGATVMPHNLYLHSALVQTRKIEKTPTAIKRAIRFNQIDSAIALNIAFFVNAAILILAATVFFKTGNSHVAEIKEAHQLLAPILGSTLAPKLFAIALIAAGQSSTITGTLAGQIVMEGYLQLRINPWLRRLLTRLVAIVPAFIVLMIYGESQVDALLVFSQVILSFQLGFAIIPLIHFVSDKKTMGAFVVKKPIQWLGWLIASILVYLNLKMVINEATPVFETGSWWARLAVGLAGAGLLTLLGYVTFFPWISRSRRDRYTPLDVHGKPATQLPVQHNRFQRIAIALDFSNYDERLLAFALGQGNPQTEYLLIHVVESASARLLGPDSDDQETREDRERLDQYVRLMTEQGYQATALLGYRKRVREITRLVQENEADLLIMGAHRHTWLFDLVFGQTVNSVRHRVDVPVLVVNIPAD